MYWCQIQTTQDYEEILDMSEPMAQIIERNFPTIQARPNSANLVSKA
jgi:hypothetical protein